MLIHELTERDCRQVLKLNNLGRLACARDNQPYIVPVYFYFDQQYLYSFATVGQKIDWMRHNPKVCVEVDDISDQFHWTSVVVFGRYEEVLDGPEHADARRRAHKLLEKRPEWWQPGSGKTASGEHHVPVIYRIRIERVSGRRAARDRV